MPLLEGVPGTGLNQRQIVLQGHGRNDVGRVARTARALLKLEELVAARHVFRKLWVLSRRFGKEEWKPAATSPDTPATPFQVRKSRRLGLTPSDASMDCAPE